MTWMQFWYAILIQKPVEIWANLDSSLIETHRGQKPLPSLEVRCQHTSLQGPTLRRCVRPSTLASRLRPHGSGKRHWSVVYLLNEQLTINHQSSLLKQFEAILMNSGQFLTMIKTKHSTKHQPSLVHCAVSTCSTHGSRPGSRERPQAIERCGAQLVDANPGQSWCRCASQSPLCFPFSTSVLTISHFFLLRNRFLRISFLAKSSSWIFFTFIPILPTFLRLVPSTPCSSHYSF